MKNSIISNTISKSALNVFNIIVPLLIYPYIYRIFSANTVGKMDYATTIFTYFSLVGLLGIYNYGLREIARKRDIKEETNYIFKNLFVLGVISNIVVFIIYFLFVYYTINDSVLKKIMYVQGFGIIGQILYIEWINEAFEDYKFITLKTIAIRVFSLCAVFLFIKNDGDYYKYVAITTATVVVNNIVSFVHIHKYLDLSFSKLCQNINIKPLIIPLFTILILNNTNLLFTVADKTILGIYQPSEEVAFYGVGQKISEMIRILFLSLVYVMIPRLSYYLENDFGAYKTGIKQMIRINFLLIAPVSIGLLTLSKEIVLIFAGNQYANAIPSMQLFALRVFILSTEAIVYNQVIFLFRKENFLMKANALCGLLNVVFDFTLCQCINSSTAILTTLICEGLFQIMCYIYIYKKLQLDIGLFKFANFKYIIISMLFIPTIWFVRSFELSELLTVIVAVFSCMTIYILLLILNKDSAANMIINKITIKK